MEGFPPGLYGKVSKYEYSIFIVIWTAPFLKKNKKSARGVVELSAGQE